MKKKKQSKIKNKSGANEWAEIRLNFITGCKNGCKYCYIGSISGRFKKSNAADRKNERVRLHDLQKKIKKYDTLVMFPSAHDITPEHLEESITFLDKILKAGNEVLVVTKPHLQCVQRICQEFESYKEKIIFRFTIGSADDSVLKFWEPNAPSFKERFDSLKYAYGSGFQTSISCEPMLDNKVEAVIEKVLPYVTDTVWIGKAKNFIGKTGRGRLDFNGENDPVTLARAKELIEWQSDKNILELYNLYKDNPKISWKDTISKIIPGKD
jgi:DNA repair photolyase